MAFSEVLYQYFEGQSLEDSWPKPRISEQNWRQFANDLVKFVHSKMNIQHKYVDFCVTFRLYSSSELDCVFISLRTR